VKSYTVVLEKWAPLYTTLIVQVEDGVADAVDAAKAAALDEACATGAVQMEPKAGAWSMRCPTEAVDYVVPVEREPKVISLCRMSADGINSGTRDENPAADRFRDSANGLTRK
jgi:hypothetical protein